MSEPSMHDLAARLARGDEAAFTELYDACADRLHAYLVGRLGSRDVASDVLQTAFLRAVRSRRRFRKVENPVAYLFQIARNEVAREIGRRRSNEQAVPSDELFAVASDMNGQAEYAEVAAAALARLSEAERELVVLKIFGGLTFREIAQIVGRPQATVATQYRRAIESLRGWLTRQLR
ncbi:MAG: RNA polymerase sigma factor [Pirellulales bacterium]